MSNFSGIYRYVCSYYSGDTGGMFEIHCFHIFKCMGNIFYNDVMINFILSTKISKQCGPVKNSFKISIYSQKQLLKNLKKGYNPHFYQIKLNGVIKKTILCISDIFLEFLEI